MTADTIGGVWQYAVDLARGLGEYGVDVTLATLGGEPSAAQRSEASQIPSLSLRTSSFALEWMPDSADAVHESGRWLLELEREIEPDIVHVNGLCHGSLRCAAPVVAVAHSCVLSWWESVRSTPVPPEWDRYRREATRGLNAADRVIAPSRSMAASIERLYGLTSVGVVPNGRNRTAGFSGGAEKSPFVLGAGRLWDEAKNLSTLDSACHDLEWPLYLAGPGAGPFHTVFEPRNGVALGALPPAELAAWMRRAEIYALPAKYEPFGLSVLEAGLCGCALVLGDIPSLRENWEDAALFVPPGDAGYVRHALQALIASPDLRAGLGSRARARAAHFTIDRMASAYLDAYAQLLDPAGETTTRLSADA